MLQLSALYKGKLKKTMDEHGCTLKVKQVICVEFIGLLWGVLAMTAWWCTATGHMVWESKVTKVTSCSL